MGSALCNHTIPVFCPAHTAAMPEDDDERAPHIGGKMQRVGFQRFAGILASHAGERARSHQIDSHRQRENHQNQQARLQMHLLVQQADNASKMM